MENRHTCGEGQIIADIEITLDLFTSWHLTEGDLMSFRLILVTK